MIKKLFCIILILTTLTQFTFAREEKKKAILLTSFYNMKLPLPWTQRKKKMVRYFKRKFYNTKYQTEIVDNATDADLWAAINDKNVEIIFWASHTAPSDDFFYIVSSAYPYSKFNYEVSDLFKQAPHHVKYIGLVGCKSDKFFEFSNKSEKLFYRKSHKDLYSGVRVFRKKTDKNYFFGIKGKVDFYEGFKKILKSMFIYKQNVENNNLDDNNFKQEKLTKLKITRKVKMKKDKKIYFPDVRLISSVDNQIVYIFPEIKRKTRSNKTIIQKRTIYIPTNKIKTNFSLRTSLMNDLKKNLIDIGTFTFEVLDKDYDDTKWNIWKNNSTGKPVGGKISNYYFYED